MIIIFTTTKGKKSRANNNIDYNEKNYKENKTKG